MYFINIFYVVCFDFYAYLLNAVTIHMFLIRYTIGECQQNYASCQMLNSVSKPKWNRPDFRQTNSVYAFKQESKHVGTYKVVHDDTGMKTWIKPLIFIQWRLLLFVWVQQLKETSGNMCIMLIKQENEWVFSFQYTREEFLYSRDCIQCYICKNKSAMYAQ